MANACRNTGKNKLWRAKDVIKVYAETKSSQQLSIIKPVQKSSADTRVGCNTIFENASFIIGCGPI